MLYVLYGSTEVAYASISTPADHRVAPTTVGKVTLGTQVRLLDDEGSDVEPGQTGRIFVSNGIEFGGYTDGRHKEVIDGVMSSGDVGHFDAEGRLFIDGRDDEMIVSGGENVFPQEVEELLQTRDDVAEVAVIGVEDEDFGKRLAAYVVVLEGHEQPAPRRSRPSSSRTWPATRFRARSTSSTSCHATRPARSSSARSPRGGRSGLAQRSSELRYVCNMSHKPADRIRNVALIGHRGGGKTSTCEALLFEAGIVNRLGRVDEGTAVADSAPDEQARGPLDRGDRDLLRVRRAGKLNLIDTPGEPSFVAQALAALRSPTPRSSSSTRPPASRSAPTASGVGRPRPASPGSSS